MMMSNPMVIGVMLDIKDVSNPIIRGVVLDTNDDVLPYDNRDDGRH